MADPSTLEACNCPETCDTNQYGYSVSSTLLDKDALCGRSEEISKETFGGPTFSLPNLFMRNFETFVSKRNMGEAENCKESLSQMAFVNFQLITQSVTRIKRDARVSFADQISSFGNQHFIKQFEDVHNMFY